MEQGTKSWQDISFDRVFPPSKKKRLIGLTFPETVTKLALEPSVLNVMPPDGESYACEYSMKNALFNDEDVLYYMCSVYISGMDEFINWANKHNKDKIIVGGYHATTFPEEFVNYAFKIVIGICDDIFETIKQPAQIVTGLTTYKSIPRYDIYDVKNNYQVIPDATAKSKFTSINTSQGCPNRCDFCCSPIMCPTLVSKPIKSLELELKENIYKPMYKFDPFPDKYLFIRDENFPLQKDWKERLRMIYNAAPKHKIYLFSSANLLTNENVKFMADYGVYMICVGLEDITVKYKKNIDLTKAIDNLKEFGIKTYLSFIVNPTKIIGREKGLSFYNELMTIFFKYMPEMVCGNFLMPFRGTKLWDEYYWLVEKKDYKYYDSKSAFLIKNEILREKMEFYMFWYQWLYYNSEEYNKMRNFKCGDTLHLRFEELYQEFRMRNERIWNVRA